MTAVKTLLPFATFAAGVALGALALRGGGETTPVAGKTKAPVKTRVAQRPAADPREAALERIGGDIARVFGENSSSREQDDWLAGLPASDIPLAVLALCDDIGPDGLPYPQRGIAKKLLARWVKEDREGALAWAESLRPAMRRYFLGEVLDAWAQEDALAAWEWVENSGDIEVMKNRSGVARGALQAHASRSAADAAAFLASLPKENGRTSVGLNYPEGFDFGTFLDGLSAMGENLPGIMPDGVLKAWASSDPDAASEWALGHPQLSFQGWGDIAEAVEAKSGREAAARWAAEQYLAADDEARRRIAREFSSRMFHPRVDLIMETAAAMDDSGAAWDFTREIVTKHWDASLGSDHLSYQIVANISGTEGRADAIAYAMAFRHPATRTEEMSDEVFQNLRRQRIESCEGEVSQLSANGLQRLGLTEADVSQALERLKHER